MDSRLDLTSGGEAYARASDFPITILAIAMPAYWEVCGSANILECSRQLSATFPAQGNPRFKSLKADQPDLVTHLLNTNDLPGKHGTSHRPESAPQLIKLR
jgi:hypothetical protein